MAEENKKYYIFEMDMLKLNILSLFLFAGMMLLSFLIAPKVADLSNINLVILFIIYMGYMLLHEILHSISYVLNGAKFKNIVYGAYLEKGVLYCLCKQNISKRNILISLMTPLVVIGIITYIISIIFNLPTLLYLSILNITGCIGDIIMFNYIVKLNKNIEFSEFDNPIQFAIYSEEDVTKIKHYGLNFIEKTSSLQKEDFKKVRVSKTSIILTIILIVILVLSLIVKR